MESSCPYFVSEVSPKVQSENMLFIQIVPYPLRYVAIFYLLREIALAIVRSKHALLNDLQVFVQPMPLMV
jgi:hypothetical protein